MLEHGLSTIKMSGQKQAPGWGNGSMCTSVGTRTEVLRSHTKPVQQLTSVMPILQEQDGSWKQETPWVPTGKLPYMYSGKQQGRP